MKIFFININKFWVRWLNRSIQIAIKKQNILGGKI